MKKLKLIMNLLKQFFTLLLIYLPITVSPTPLDDYVNQYDPHYEFKIVNYTYKGAGYTLYCLNMTSQKWLTGNLFF